MYKPSRWYVLNSGEPIGDPFGGPAFGKYQDPTTALVIGGATLGSALLGSDAAQSAADTQANAANNASATQLQMFNTINDQNAPYRQAGQTALGDILGGVGNGPASGGVPAGYFAHQFGANDLNANLAPNYQFQLDQGLGAVKNAGNLQSGLISGNTLKGVNDYAQNYAGGAYQNAYNNYTTNQNNIFNRLATIAGFGSGANQTTASAGTTTAGNVGNAQMAAGAAQAAGTVGSANALSGGLTNASSWFALPQIMKMGQPQIAT